MLFREVSFIFIIHSENITEHVITLCQSNKFLSINSVSTRTTLFWDITKHVVICYRHSRTTCRSHPHGSRIQKDWILEL